ncbi:MAG: acyl-CoA thioesterase [Nesterenkonia sp.]
MSEMRIPIQLRWGDQDAYGHVNNVAIMRVLEEGRARAFWSGSDPQERGILPPLASGQPVWTLVADFQLKYRQQLDYQREPVTVEMTIPKIGGASFVIEYALKAAAEDPAPKVTASSTMVMVDGVTGRPQRIDAETRSRLQLWSGGDAS